LPNYLRFSHQDLF